MFIRRIALVAALAAAPVGGALAHGSKEDHAKETDPAKQGTPAAAPAGHEGQGAKKGAHSAAADAAPKTTLTGEVLDLACYVQHPATGQGAKHAGCAQQCINKGLPAGLKVGDKVYLLMGRGHDSIAEKIAPLAGKNATVTGAVLESGGLTTLVVDSATAAP